METAFMILGMHRKKPFHYKSPVNPVKQSILRLLDQSRGAIISQPVFSILMVALSMVLAACVAVDETSKKNPQIGLITTPASYYTTQKARHLGEKYHDNLDRLVERIVRNPKTANLQFANNIASVGGIGFFTHSASGSVDERFLEVVVGVPETFDTKSDHNAKVSRVFSSYGAELLSILSSDQQVYQEKELNGYGLNFSWRNLVPDGNSPRVALERAVLYFSKASVRSFLKGDLAQNNLLAEAVMFSVIDDGPMKLVSFRPQELKPDLRLPIAEQTLATDKNSSNSSPGSTDLDVTLAATPLPSMQGPQKDVAESLPVRIDGPVEHTASTNFRETPKDFRDTSTSLAEPNEVPTFSSPLLLETAEAPSADRRSEALLAGEPPSRLASLEQRNTDAPAIVPKGSLAPTDVPVPGNSGGGALKLESSGSGGTAGKLLETDSATRPSQVLQGFIVQVAFADKRDAHRWAETLERRGYAISITEPAGGGSVRLRVGSFAIREDAERQLQALRQDGLKGIVLNIPQAYRPEARPGGAEEDGKAVSAVR